LQEADPGLVKTKPKNSRKTKLGKAVFLWLKEIEGLDFLPKELTNGLGEGSLCSAFPQFYRPNVWLCDRLFVTLQAASALVRKSESCIDGASL
jgi:hypothetical protein